MSDRSVRKQRVINATDSERDIVRARAKAARLSASGYVVRRALSAEVSDGPSLTTLSARLERIETALLTLCEVERVRLAERGEEEGWTAALRRVAMQQRTDLRNPVTSAHRF
ncbi:plasmid mobilization protein [Ruegeria sp.]|uniref:plasmid mobilization protein n=1 Tax=Ruegeria sp. TaxID=1879320 RepID=UPI003B009488